MLPIRNEHRYEMFDPQIEFAAPLVPRELTFGVDERVLADGEVLRGVDAAEVDAISPRCAPRTSPRSAICLINAYTIGERAAMPICSRRAPDLYLSLSSTSRRKSANIRAPRPSR